MIAGHFATALLPKARNPQLPLLWLLIAANFPDYLCLLFVFLFTIARVANREIHFRVEKNWG